MEPFYKTHLHLVENVNSSVRRLLMDEIDWTKRLIGIKGSRGVGKTTFLLQFAKERFGAIDRDCLYVNFNNFYFAGHSLTEFAEEFYNKGGQVLLLDQLFKYENWSKELRYCYDTFPNLQIVFTGSSVMRLVEDNEDLQDIITPYHLRGFSFREYLNLQTGLSLKSYTLTEILSDHERIAERICKTVNPLVHFASYLHHGYYPFYLENRNYSENLLKTMNMMLEVDILLIKQIDIKYLSKIRKLLYIILENSPSSLNVSQLSDEIETSRLTVMNYIKYLQDARLINLLYTAGESFPKKPKMLYLQNTNLMHALSIKEVDKDNEAKTFLYNTLQYRHRINLGKQQGDFFVDNLFNIKYLKSEAGKNKPAMKLVFAVDNMLVGYRNKIPLWLFGFLY
ncbi:MAG: AAA family ATPase [Paludibacteraceae bacterium]